MDFIAAFRDMALDKEFLGKVFIGVVITAIAVPSIKAFWDRRNKLHEARMQRQSETIQQQIALLKDYIELLWSFNFASLQLTYFLLMAEQGGAGRGASASPETYEEAFRKYEEEAWKWIQKHRMTVSSAVHLVDETQHKRMIDFHRILLETEMRITADTGRNVFVSRPRPEPILIERPFQRVWNDLATGLQPLERESSRKPRYRYADLRKLHHFLLGDWSVRLDSEIFSLARAMNLKAENQPSS